MPEVGGIAPVIADAQAAGKFEFWPEANWAAIVTFIAGLLTMGIGSIPQQDIFQRANSSKNVHVAVWGTTLGGVAYFLFAAVPMYLTYAATMVDPVQATTLLEENAELVLPTFVVTHLPMVAQVVFFGALLSVIMSTASGTLLAPSVTISENLLKPFLDERQLTDERFLWITRVVVALFAIGVTLYALWSLESSTSIHQMVENAYKVTMATAFVPLFAGLFWSRANNMGAGTSIILGLVFWLGMEFVAPEAAMPPQFAGFIASIIGMVVGSLLPSGRQTATA